MCCDFTICASVRTPSEQDWCSLTNKCRKNSDCTAFSSHALHVQMAALQVHVHINLHCINCTILTVIRKFDFGCLHLCRYYQILLQTRSCQCQFEVQTWLVLCPASVWPGANTGAQRWRSVRVGSMRWLPGRGLSRPAAVSTWRQREDTSQNDHVHVRKGWFISTIQAVLCPLRCGNYFLVIVKYTRFKWIFSVNVRILWHDCAYLTPVL